jgi:HemY protein
MRAALWLLAWFGVAVAIALFAGNNQGVVTLFWPPHRVDLSLNLTLLLLFAVFVFLHAVLGALGALFDLPRKARRWRSLQSERAMHGSLLDALSHLLAGRFIRARKSAQAVLDLERTADQRPAVTTQVRTLAHLLVAESAQALQDKSGREEHLRQALEHSSSREAQETREGALMWAARWALADHEPDRAMTLIKEMPQGAARRTVALRLKLKAARLADRTAEALETARLLSKHKAFSAGAAQSLVRGLATELLNGAHDASQLQNAWNCLEPGERLMPELAILGAQRLIALNGQAHLARDWLLPVWERQGELGETLKFKLVRALEAGLESLDAAWLARIEEAQKANPRDFALQYLAGAACIKRQLWGKAQQLMSQAAAGLRDTQLQRSAWRALALLAQERGDEDAAMQAWKRAASD